MKAIDKLRKYLPQFTWTQKNSTSSLFGAITAPQKQIRIGGDLYKLDNVYIFISSKMGGTPNNPPFRYAICYQKGTCRPYRHKNSFYVEFNKLFVSAKDLDSIVNELIKKVDLNRYYLPK
jgi:hypothetical protein